MDSIKLNEALKIMESGEVFSIQFVTYDKKRKTGGFVKFYPEARLLQKTDSPAKQVKSESSGIKRKTKNPNHWDNATRNIKVIVNGIESSGNKKLHIFLMTMFNGKRVYL